MRCILFIGKYYRVTVIAQLRLLLLLRRVPVGLAGFVAGVAGGVLAGEMVLDLSTRLPKSLFTGKFDGPFRTGTVNLEGTATAGGNVTSFLSNLLSSGTLRARGISLGPELEFRSAIGDYEVNAGSWKFSNLEVMQAAETLRGGAATQSDGRLALDLTGGERKVRDAVVLFPEP